VEGLGAEEMADRSDFLLRMYEQMFRDIAQAYTVVWQSAATVFASFAAIALAANGIVPLDIAVSVVLLVLVWFRLNVIECAYWYNRNLCIIANIEKQFLLASDLKDIQYYFGSHRPNNKTISHLRNQDFLAYGLGVLIIGYHFVIRVLPGVTAAGSVFEPIRMIPYIVAAVGLWYLARRQAKRNEAYAEFVGNSPGASVDTTGVSYGVGHGH
jgi:hypothetical protein